MCPAAAGLLILCEFFVLLLHFAAASLNAAHFEIQLQFELLRLLDKLE